MAYLICDVETGGLDANKHAITEIAIIVLDMKTLEEKYRWETFIKPYGLEYDQHTLDFTKITMKDVESGINMKDVVLKMIELSKTYKPGKYQNCIFVGHNFSFDRGFIKKAFELAGKKENEFFDEYYEDTLRLSQRCWANTEMVKFKLGLCCEKAEIELFDSHNAMADTLATSKLFIYHTNRMRNSQATSGEQSNDSRTRSKITFEIA